MEPERGCGCGVCLFLVLAGFALVVLVVPFVGLPLFALAAIGALAYGWVTARRRREDVDE